MLNIVGDYCTKYVNISKLLEFRNCEDSITSMQRVVPRRETMSEENEAAGVAAVSKNSKFTLLAEEEVLLETKPSFFAFFGMYVLAIMVFCIHMLFYWYADKDTSNLEGLEHMAAIIVKESGIAGFFVMMLVITWANRFINMSTSGRWFTFGLLLISITPALFTLDELLTEPFKLFGFTLIENPLIGDNTGGYLPTWDPVYFLILGVGYFVMLVALTFYYQHSFAYAITSDAVIFRRDFMLNSSQRRVLYGNIQDLNVEKGAIGSILGFGTVVPLTGSGLGIGEETMGISAGGAAGSVADSKEGDSAPAKGFKMVLRMFFALLSAQRTVRTIKPDPAQCFFGIRGPDKVYAKVAEMWQSFDPSGQMEEIKDLLAANLKQE